MAAPGTHTVLASKVYKKYFSDKNFSDYIVGNNFPDIRYLGVIERDATHFYGLKISDFIGDTPFLAGVKLHSVVDEVREAYMKKNGIYSFFPDSPLKSQAVKFFEDCVLYDKIDNWNEIVASFDNVLPEERAFGIEEQDLLRWHGFLKLQLSHKPEETDLKKFTLEAGKPESLYFELLRVVHGVSDEQRAREIVLKFYDEFDKLIA